MDKHRFVLKNAQNINKTGWVVINQPGFVLKQPRFDPRATVWGSLGKYWPNKGFSKTIKYEPNSNTYCRTRSKPKKETVAFSLMFHLKGVRVNILSRD